MIKEMVRVLFSLLFGKKYVCVEQEDENRYEVSGKKLSDFKAMIDLGNINEAENILLDGIDHTQINEIAAAALFISISASRRTTFCSSMIIPEKKPWTASNSFCKVPATVISPRSSIEHTQRDCIRSGYMKTGIIGVAIGDALGVPVEFEPRAALAESVESSESRR